MNSVVLHSLADKQNLSQKRGQSMWVAKCEARCTMIKWLAGAIRLNMLEDFILMHLLQTMLLVPNEV